MSVKEYKEYQEKLARLETLMETLENIRLLRLAGGRLNDHTVSFEAFANEQGFTMNELEALSESVEFE